MRRERFVPAYKVRRIASLPVRASNGQARTHCAVRPVLEKIARTLLTSELDDLPREREVPSGGDLNARPKLRQICSRLLVRWDER